MHEETGCLHAKDQKPPHRPFHSVPPAISPSPNTAAAFSDSAASPARLCQVPRARASISRWRRDERRRRASRAQMAAVSLLRAAALGLVVLASALPSARPWSKEGHVLTCQIAQVKTNRIVEAS